MNKMPEDIAALLEQIPNYDDVVRIQNKWHEYAKANEVYELNYPQQFGNLVEANLKFKEQKSIPTPAEQMAQYNETIRGELTDLLQDKHHEDVYYEEPSEGAPVIETKFDSFKMSGKDIFDGQPREISSLDDYQIPWIKKYYEDRQKESHEQGKEQELEKEDLDMEYE